MIGSTKASRRTLAAAASLVLASSLGACGLEDSGTRRATNEIVIGISLPLTGDFSEPGKGVQRGYEAWAKYVNENGGLLGQAGPARDPRRPVQRRPGRLGLREADQPGRRSTSSSARSRPGSSIPAAQVAKDYGFLFVEPAGARRGGLHRRASTTSSTPPPRSPTTTTTCSPSRSSRCPEGERPKTAAYAVDGRPVRAGHGVRPQGQARGGRHQDRRRRGLPARTPPTSAASPPRSPTPRPTSSSAARSTRTR